MPIDTVRYYNPTMKEPVYVKITTPRQNTYDVFKEYRIRIADEEDGDEGPYNYIHEAVLISKEECEWNKVPDLLKGYVANTRDPNTALARIHPKGEDGSFDNDDEVVILVFLRKDKAKDLILSDNNVMDPQKGSIERIDDYES